MKLPIILADEEQRRKILEELLEEEVRHKVQLEVFKQWIKCEKHLPSDLDDSYLENFLRLCKHDLEKAKKKFEANLILRKGQWHLNYEYVISKDELQHYDLAKQIVIMPNLTENGYRVTFVSFPNEATKFDLKYLFKYAMTLGDVLFHADLTAGVICITDMTNFTINHWLNLEFTTLHQFLHFAVLTLPSRLKAYHLINFPSIAKPFVAMIKAAMPKKIRNRIFIHKDVVHLKHHLEDEVIPKDYGGNCNSFDSLAKDWENFYLEDNEWKEKLKKLKLRGPTPKAKTTFGTVAGFWS